MAAAEHVAGMALEAAAVGGPLAVVAVKQNHRVRV